MGVPTDGTPETFNIIVPQQLIKQRLTVYEDVSDGYLCPTGRTPIFGKFNTVNPLPINGIFVVFEAALKLSPTTGKRALTTKGVFTIGAPKGVVYFYVTFLVVNRD
jgi:hypothetical protein